jgi:transcriptional adapter 2-alpha
MGITTGAEAEAYEAAKVTRVSSYVWTRCPTLNSQLGYRTAPAQRERQPEVVTGARVNAGQHRFLHGAVSTPPPDKNSREPTPRAPVHPGRKPRKLLRVASLLC